MQNKIDQESFTAWSDIKEARTKVSKQYPSIHKIPLVYSTKKMLIKSILQEFNGKLLDIGAGDRFVGEICSNQKNIEYKSMDADDTRFHDYYSLNDIDEKFSGIMILDVIEHLSLNKGTELLQRCIQLLEPGGRTFITIPNNCHPTAFSVDCTHTTSYRYHDLGGLLFRLGFIDIQIIRVSAKRKLKYRIMASLLKPVFKFLDVDFATGILVVGQKTS